jgi:hypothetical protein
MSYNTAQAATALRKLGFRIRTTGEYHQAVRTFQGGYNLGAWLALDGVCGPKTQAAIARCVANGGRASAHFFWTEWKCTCGGRFSSCRRVLVDRNLLRRLEAYRSAVGSVAIVSGYRCPGRNHEVGGVSGSRHLLGQAADIRGRLKLSSMQRFGFNGNGVQGSTGLVVHVDVRPTRVRPWTYRW